MKRRYFHPEGSEARYKEETLYDLIPESAVDEAEKYIETYFDYPETAERELIVRSQCEFEILTETTIDYRAHIFNYEPLTGAVRYLKCEGDFKRG